MANERNQPEAEKTVFENLGMSKEELGVVEEGSGNEDEQSQATEQGQEPAQERQYEDLDAEPKRQTPADFQQPKPFPRAAPVKPDAKGNLIDAQGKIVARAGKEARLYTERHNARAQAQKVTAERDEVVGRLHKAVEIGQELYAENERLKAGQEQIRTLGLEPNELLQAAQFAAEGKRNPLETLKKLLTMAAANGIDLTQLGLPGNSGIDPKSLMDMVRQELGNQLKPVRDKTEAETQAQKIQRDETLAQQQVEGQVRTFFTQNPEARPHIAIFQAVLSRPQFAGMSLGEVWARIQLNAMQNGRSLNGERARSPSLPNGRMPGSRVGTEIASPDTSYDSVIRDVLKNV